jgi:polysaccharide export outer membrane protein
LDLLSGLRFTVACTPVLPPDPFFLPSYLFKNLSIDSFTQKGTFANSHVIKAGLARILYFSCTTSLMKKPYGFILALFLLGCLLHLTSCINTKDLIGLQDDQVSTKSIVNYGRFPTYLYKVRPHDMLTIQLNSYQENTATFFQGNGGGNMRVDPASLYVSSYTIDESGNIRLPLIGDMQVSGLSIEQIKDSVDKGLEPWMKYASTTVKLSSFRVTLMGEVNGPGMQYIYNTKTNLLQVISMAGDFTDFANRQKVKILRERGQETEAVYVDMSSSEFLNSEYYFLMPDDVIYVEPLKSKAWNLNTRTASVLLSSVSVSATLINLFVTLQNRTPR